MPFVAAGRARRAGLVLIVIVVAAAVVLGGLGAILSQAQRVVPMVRGVTLSASQAGPGSPVFMSANATDPLGIASVEVRVDATAWAPMASLASLGGQSVQAAALVNAPVHEIGIGAAHVCALLAGGTVRCVGAGWAGQLGNDATLDSSVPVSVFGIATATSIAVGRTHACAVLAGGSVVCWGSGTSGELGDGRKRSSASPIAAARLSGVTAIAAGAARTCALLDMGAVACWGDNANGAAGQPGGSVAEPTRVAGIEGAIGISVGAQHACAVLGSGAVACWGGNRFGQLGTPTIEAGSHPSPSVVAGLPPAIGVVAGDSFTCALLRDGTARCWGANSSGELGGGDIDSLPHNVPSPVADASGPLTGLTALVAGGRHACALAAEGQVRCWGADDTGQLGEGSPGSPRMPATAVPGVAGATALAAGGDHACAVLADGWLRCWGDAGPAWLPAPDIDAGPGSIAPTPLAGHGGLLSTGRHELCVRATDLAGNVAEPVCVSLSIGTSGGVIIGGGPTVAGGPSAAASASPPPSPSLAPRPTASPGPSPVPSASVAASPSGRPDSRSVVSLAQTLLVNGAPASGAPVSVKSGTSVTSAVRATPAMAGLALELWRQSPGEVAVKVGSVTLDAAGTARFGWQAARADASYTWRFAGTATVGPATSDSIRVLVGAGASSLPVG